MFLYKYTLLYIIIYIVSISVNAKSIDDVPVNLALAEDSKADEYRSEPSEEKVKIQLFYESYCRACERVYTLYFAPTVEKLGPYLDVKTYPYGFAETIINKNGTYTFKCQHGDIECYGNKLHACAIDYLGNITKAVIYNACMEDTEHTDDETADECGKKMNIDPTEIKKCAKGKKGMELLKYYGDETHKLGNVYIPYILLNGYEHTYENAKNLMKDVCAAFTKPPPPCKHLLD